MQSIHLSVCRDYAFAGLLVSLRTTIKMVMDQSGTAIMSYAFLAGLVAMVALVSFDAMGTAVASLYDAIATAFTASMPQSP